MSSTLSKEIGDLLEDCNEFESNNQVAHFDHEKAKVMIADLIKQVAIEFSNFCSERYHGIRGDKGWMMVESPFTKYTDDEAYELYFLHKQNKEQ